ncbi:MAG: nucleotidyltransferase family protein [Sphingomonas sp.]|uniref:nucleotidyltransferase family protein n=1 Tax=Sphingomonas sp. TaxID=28214 RepID=UPI003F80A7BC
MTEQGAIDPEEIAKRLRRAAARGNPAWLWPDIDIERRARAMSAIARATQGVLVDGCATIEGDAAAIGVAAYVSGMGPLLGWWAADGRLAADEAITAALREHWRHNRDRAGRLRRACAAITGALTAAGVPTVVLKGLDTESAYFPALGTRPASDIDLLVSPEQVTTAERILWSRGLIPTSRGRLESTWHEGGAPAQPNSLYLVHRDDPWTVDLHHSLDIEVAPGAPVARLDIGRPMATSRRWGDPPTGYALDQPLLALHLAVHAGHGLHNLTLVRLVELVLVIRRDSASGRLSWLEFDAIAVACDALGYAYPALAFAEQLAPGTVPPGALAACARAAPRRVVEVVRRLTPATAQRLGRLSLAEHFMWTRGPRGWGKQLAADLIPHKSLRRSLEIYRARGWQLLGGLRLP